ncbi:hypothetical protein ACJRO7_017650 [Eucalyptus globulus]|uniref:Uncharacterized protein n=1 Tax=Eucalyptus globulus TaxID=34317 RepID=A0ABD3L228_EUCGL
MLSHHHELPLSSLSFVAPFRPTCNDRAFLVRATSWATRYALPQFAANGKTRCYVEHHLSWQRFFIQVGGNHSSVSIGTCQPGRDPTVIEEPPNLERSVMST